MLDHCLDEDPVELESQKLSVPSLASPMPARGGLPDLSDQEIRGAIIYMFNYGVPEVAAPPPAPSHRTAWQRSPTPPEPPAPAR